LEIRTVYIQLIHMGGTEPTGGASPTSTVGRPGRAAARGARARSHFILNELRRGC
jgi:hypothetical protein